MKLVTYTFWVQYRTANGAWRMDIWMEQTSREFAFRRLCRKLSVKVHRQRIPTSFPNCLAHNIYIIHSSGQLGLSYKNTGMHKLNKWFCTWFEKHEMCMNTSEGYKHCSNIAINVQIESTEFSTSFIWIHKRSYTICQSIILDYGRTCVTEFND